METTIRTLAETLNLIQTCKAVKSIGPWGEGSGRRYYLDLWDASRTFRGDQTAKWYLDTRGVLNYEPGKGTRSTDFQDSVAVLNTFLAEHGIECRKVV